MANTGIYQNQVRMASVGRSVFDLSYQHLFNAHPGKLYPACVKSVVPNDVVSLGNEIVIRLLPMVAPVLHEINCDVHYFFVPNRLLDTNWEEFITGGEDGTSSVTLTRADNYTVTKYDVGDYLGFPVGVTFPLSHDTAPLQLPISAYNEIYNEWYRNPNVESTIGLSQKVIQLRQWEKDYFTSALPWQQRGTAPAVSLSGSVPITGIGKLNTNYQTGPQAVYETGGSATTNYANFQAFDSGTHVDKTMYLEEDPNNSGYPGIFADASNITTFDTSDLRLVVAIQKWLERNARAGGRYVEFIQAHFGISADSLDARLQRPEYIGGTRQSVIVSEVLNTSATATEDQGHMAGHGLSADGQGVGRYRVKEYGIIMGMLSIVPRTTYNSQGVDREWLHLTKYDFYHPEFANLSEQSILLTELYSQGNANDEDVFGYQGKYDHMRSSKDLVSADMRDTFDYWHLARQFSSAPTLNTAFTRCAPRWTDIFASTSEPPFIVHINNKIIANRPMPVTAEPGLMDH